MKEVTGICPRVVYPVSDTLNSASWLSWALCFCWTQTPCINVIIWYPSSCDCLVSLSRTFSRFIFVIDYIRMFLHFKTEYHFSVCIFCILHISSSFDGWGMLLYFNYCEYCCCNVSMEIFPWRSTFNVLIKIKLLSLQTLLWTLNPTQIHEPFLIIIVIHTQEYTYKYINKTLWVHFACMYMTSGLTSWY